MKMKRIPGVLLLLLLVVTLAGILYNALRFIGSDTGVLGEEVEVIIPEGASAATVARILKEHGIIPSEKRFTILAKLSGQDKRIKAGRYLFRRGMGIRTILGKLVRGETKPLRVTIPEGLTIEEIAELLAEVLDIDGGRFLTLAKDKKRARHRGIERNDFEGFLFPNTYDFNHGVGEEEILERLVNEFWDTFDDSLKRRAREIGFTVYETVILASLIEEEAMLEKEHATISQVYHKRLKLGRALECDATVQYALPEHKSRLLYSDLKIDSPYNTYLHTGLPPGPIANPGRSALVAALHPAKSDFLYYVARGDGSHIFSRTAKEHYAAIENLKKLRGR
jgi:UPF0755 protein